MRKTKITGARVDTSPLVPGKTRAARIRWMEALIVGIVGVASFLGFGATVALWSSSEESGDVTVQVGDLDITIKEDFTWIESVRTDPSVLPPTMRYADPQEDDEGVLIGDVFGGTNNPIPLGGDWTKLELTFTGLLTKVGDNLIVVAHLVPTPYEGVSPDDITYTVTMTSRLNSDVQQSWTFPSPNPTDAMDAEGYPMTVIVPGEYVDVTVTVSFTGDALGILKQISTPETPGSITIDPMFSMRVSQVRP